jgi:hypothetical protein
MAAATPAHAAALEQAQLGLEFLIRQMLSRRYRSDQRLPSQHERVVGRPTKRNVHMALTRVTAELEADLWPGERLDGLMLALERDGASQPTAAPAPPRLLQQQRVLAVSFLLDVAGSREAFSRGESLIEAALRDTNPAVRPGAWRVVSVVFPRRQAR